MGNTKLDLRRRATKKKQRLPHLNKGTTPSKRTRRPVGRDALGKQGELAFRSWGGARKGAGRKPKGARPLVPHDTRPAHKASRPVLVTTRVAAGLPSLRRSGEADCIRMAFERASKRARFQVEHHSIQSNHLHLIVEAEDRRALSRGVQGVLIRIARSLNRLWGRRGRVFGDRFHERELSSPRQVRNALVYVLQNSRKHGVWVDGPDPFSSGPEFDGWLTRVVGPAERADARGAGRAASAPGHRELRLAGRCPVPQAKTWMLSVGWSRHGLIDLRESPAGS
jgi:REP element-mobilizing transposase RayT